MSYQPASDSEDYPEHQLRALKGGRYTDVFHGPPGTDVGDLHCDLEPYIEGTHPAVINHSGWLPSDKQIQQLEAGAHIRLSVWSHPIPPLAVSVEPPVCSCHREPMAWSPDEGGYRCPHNSRPAVDEATAAERQVRGDFRPAPDET